MEQKMKPKWWQGGLFYLIILLAILALAFSLLPNSSKPEKVDFYTFVEQAKQGEIDTIEQDGSTLIGLKDDEKKIEASFVGSTKELMDSLKEAGIALGEDGITFTVKAGGFDWGGILISFIPLVLFGALLFFLFRSARGANTQAFNFAKSRARLAGNKPTVTFSDVAGVDEAKGELQEIVEFLKSPQKFLALGARIPRGVLLVGPPGCGKTLIAKAVAGEAGVPFFSISGSEFVEMFVGVGASRVRDLFEQAKRNSPCIVFVDEIDAVGRHRGAGLGGGHDEREQTLNQILVEMDGFDSSTNVIVLAATNRPDILDPALLRPGRFDRHVVIDQPDINGRKAILQVHSKGKPLAKDANMEVIAKQTPGFSGADLANLINEGALLAARRDMKQIGLKELEDSIDRVIAGPEKKGRIISQKEKEIIAYHETGHALVGKMLPNSDPVHKISIVARGMMGGWTRFLPTEDRHLWTHSQFEDRLAVGLAGRAAEEINFGEVSTGAQNDLEQATSLARRMVTEYGMSTKLGPRTFGKREELVFLGREIHEQRNYSEKVAEEIDDEVKKLIQNAYDTARKILSENKARLKLVAERLMAKETIEEKEFDDLLKEPLPSPELQATPAS
ncbi:MAG: ATP-dependent zinc metalloprotease FtsH [Chloroflexota bacterium]|nr:MAG: ATP-dependent zinc metalloprotease FtsH [Chloroflexota bacterium]